MGTREPSVKTLRSHYNTSVTHLPVFWTRCVLSGGTQRRALSLPERENETTSFPRVKIKPTTVTLTVRHFDDFR